MMDYQKLTKRTLVFANLLIVKSFTAPPAYVHKDAEFNRESSGLINGFTSGKNVSICYHKDETTPQFVADLARNA